METRFLSAAVPNPYKPLLLFASPGAGHGSQPSLDRLRTRRAGILATTRRLLAETGHERLTVRRISEECDVTVQTIHNSFGCRLELLVSALNEHTTAIERAASSASSGPLLFLNLADLYYRCALETPAFLREMVFTAFSTKRPLMQMQRHGTLNKTSFLRNMAQRHVLRDNVNAEMLATQITRVNTLAVFEWAHHDDADELRRQMIFGNRLLLLGALRSSAVPEIEEWVAFQASRRDCPIAQRTSANDTHGEDLAESLPVA